MAVYFVTWNINKEKANYASARQAFIDNLEAQDSIKTGLLDSVHWISTDMSADDLLEYARRYMDDNDTIYIAKLFRGEKAAFCPARVINWVNERL